MWVLKENWLRVAKEKCTTMMDHSTRESGGTTKDMDLESLSPTQRTSMKDIGSMIRKAVKERWNSQMAVFTRETGGLISNMGLEL